MKMRRRKTRKKKTIVVINLRMMTTTMKKTKGAMKKRRKKRSSMRMILKICAPKSLPNKVVIIIFISCHTVLLSHSLFILLRPHCG